MSDIKRFSLIKPTVKTPFYIDFDWWKRTDNNWRVLLLDSLCPEHRAAFADLAENECIDWIDPDTAEVQSVDGLQHILITHCARQEGFLTEHTMMVDAVFRTLLANGNIPMTPIELSSALGKPAETILRTLAGPQVYRGIRPRQA
jgi:hypothetical protein